MSSTLHLSSRTPVRICSTSFECMFSMTLFLGQDHLCQGREAADQVKNKRSLQCVLHFILCVFKVIEPQGTHMVSSNQPPAP